MGNNPSSGLSDGTIEEIRRNTNFSKREIREKYEAFKGHFPDGAITRDQFKVMYSKMFPGGNATKYASYVFNAYDIDGNGVVDFNEYMQTISVAVSGDPEACLRWAFRLYDLDGDGHVTQEEMVEMITAIYELRGKKNARQQAIQSTHRIFGSLHKDRGDSLSQSEFFNAYKRSKVFREVI